MDGLSSTEFAFVAALYLFSPTALQAQQGDFGQMLRAATPGEARQRIRDAEAQARHGPDTAALAEAAAARRRKLEAEREAYAAISAAWRQQRPGASAPMTRRPLVASSANTTP